MIAALASGLLGQIEGLSSASSAISGISSLLDKPAGPGLPLKPQAANPAPLHHGSFFHRLSSGVQQVLLGQQEEQDSQPAIQADDLGSSLRAG